jgi:hypothetical protein
MAEGLEVQVQYADLSGETFLGTNPREVELRINGRELRRAYVRLTVSDQRVGFGIAERGDGKEGEGVFRCALRRARENRSVRYGPTESRR